MKVTPLARKVRDLARGHDVKQRPDRLWTRWLTLAIVFALTVLITSPTLWRPGLPTGVGEEITEPIIAQFTFSYLPEDAEEQWRARAEREHTRVFRFDSAVQQRNLNKMREVFEAIEEASSTETLSAARARELLRPIDASFAAWSDEELERIVPLALDERFQNRALAIVSEIYDGDLLLRSQDWMRFESDREFVEVRAVNLPAEPEANPRRFPESTNERLRFLIPQRMGSVLAAQVARAPGAEVPSGALLLETPPGAASFRFLRLFVQPNTHFDHDATAQRLADFPREAPVVVERGQRIAPAATASDTGATTREQLAGLMPHRITAEEALVLSAYRSEMTMANLTRFGAQVAFVLIAFLIISFFVIKFSRELQFNTHTVLLLSLPVLLALALGRIVLVIGGGDTAGIAGYAFPAGLIGILGVLLLDVRMALLLVTWGCILFGLEANLEYEYVIVGLFGGYTGVAALYTFRERREVLYAGILIGLVNASTILILYWIGGGAAGDEPWVAAAVGALAGVACALISFAVLPVFEVMFHITTDMRLLELSGLQHPLLREMEERAPGTLQHTMNVAKLAESAATAIGVNYLLVRAGVYFHDIGKMSKPEYFTENQLTPEDKRRHEELRPQMSTLIIRNHVKEGLELARKHKLPGIVRDFIAEHHGTSIIRYFYHKAMTAYERGELKEPVREEDYRYPGPKPQTIESAVVMLADTVEATVTAKLSGKTVREDDLQMIVRNSIVEKFNDGQFDNCNLTLRDLNLIRSSFLKTLRSRFHSRIDYPGARKGDAPASSRKEQKEAKGAKSKDLTQHTSQQVPADEPLDLMKVPGQQDDE